MERNEVIASIAQRAIQTINEVLRARSENPVSYNLTNFVVCNELVCVSKDASGYSVIKGEQQPGTLAKLDGMWR